MSIMDLFRSPAATAQQGTSQNQQQPQGNPQQGQNPPPQAFQGGNTNVQQGQAPSNTPPGTPNSAQAGSGVQNTGGQGQGTGGANQPLDNFKDLWNPGEAPKENPLFNINDQAFNSAVSGMDFTRSIAPEVMQKALAGDQQSFVTAMNSVSQAAFAQSMRATAGIMEQALNRKFSEFEGKLPSHVKNINMREGLAAENPVFNHPASKPMLSMLQSQLAQKYPDASQQELMEQAKSYLTDFIKVAQGPQEKQQAADKSKNSESFNWESYLLDSTKQGQQ